MMTGMDAREVAARLKVPVIGKSQLDRVVTVLRALGEEQQPGLHG
jgi:hypothetical protein